MVVNAKRAHKWAAPPPGQGNPATQRMCTECGVRFTTAFNEEGDETVCEGKHPESITETSHDYEPIG